MAHRRNAAGDGRLPAMAGWTILAGLMLALAGCGGSYVNIPQQDGSFAQAEPNRRVVMQVQMAAIAGLLDRYPVDGSVRIELPPGTEAVTYATVADGAGPDVYAASELDAEDAAATLEVHAVRVRGTSAEVDIIRPRRDREGEQMVTVYLNRPPFADWTPRRVRPWQGPVQRTW